jgi:hypothetical protein
MRSGQPGKGESVDTGSALQQQAGRLRAILRSGLAVFALVALVSLAVNAGVACCRGIPLPAIHDEFAYLLAGDTFAHGRLTNPTPAGWEHFETFHVFQHPTRQAKFPPGQGLFLALGTVVFGHAIFGVWLSLALACGATAWALCAALPCRWALVAGLIAALNPFMVSWWGQSYWGGAAAMLGGALLLGGLCRFLRGARPLHAAAMLLGFAIVANTRLDSAAILALVCAEPAIAAWRQAWRSDATRPRALQSLVVVLAGVALLAAWILYYNWRLGGNALKCYYTLWQAGSSPSEAVRAYAGSSPQPLPARFMRLWGFYFVMPALALGLVGLVRVGRDRLQLFGLSVAAAFFAGYAIYSRAWPHYVAPVAVLVYGLLASGLGQLASLRWGSRRWGALAVFCILAMFAFQSAIELVSLSCAPARQGWAASRQTVIDNLTKLGGNHLVFVHYGPAHNQAQEWVYNDADIPSARIIWARELGPAADSALATQYAGRGVWKVMADQRPVLLEPAAYSLAR